MIEGKEILHPLIDILTTTLDVHVFKEQIETWLCIVLEMDHMLNNNFDTGHAPA